MKIVWIDDDGELLDYQIPALQRAGFDITVLSDVDEAWEYLNKNSGKYKGIILDVMMGTGRLLIHEDTNGGMRTGEQFLRKLLKEKTHGDAKILVYTIVEDVTVKAAVEQLGVRLFKKQSHPGHALARLVMQEFGVPQYVTKS